MKIYEGVRGMHRVIVTVTQPETGRLPLPTRYDLRNHSPDGFNWGYPGSGPAQLALAICADALKDDERALRIYQIFKNRVVAQLAGERFSLAESTVLEEIRRIEESLL